MSQQLATYNFLTTVDTSIIEGEDENEIEKTLSIIEHLGYSRDDLCKDDINIVKYVCSVITIRGSVLTALGLATLINRIDRDKVIIYI